MNESPQDKTLAPACSHYSTGQKKKLNLSADKKKDLLVQMIVLAMFPYSQLYMFHVASSTVSQNRS